MAGIKSKQRNTLLKQATGQARTHHHNFTNTPAYVYHHQENRGIILHVSYTTAQKLASLTSWISKDKHILLHL
jgi:hypothetical protein